MRRAVVLLVLLGVGCDVRTPASQDEARREGNERITLGAAFVLPLALLAGSLAGAALAAGQTPAGVTLAGVGIADLALGIGSIVGGSRERRGAATPPAATP